MQLENLRALHNNKSKKRVGRGVGSGMGKTSTRGHKGQNARSGGGVRPGFEGGQMPLFRRLPKRGFHNKWRIDYDIVNLKDLNRFNDGDVVELASLVEKGLIRSNAKRVKILASGNLERKLTIKVDKVSESAKELIEKSGSTVEVK